MHGWMTAHPDSLATPERNAAGQFLNGHHTGSPRKFQSIEAFQATLDAYFADRDLKGKPYHMAGLARALKCSRQTIINYEQYDDAEPFVDAIKLARAKCEETAVDLLLTKSGVHPAGPIFCLKNNHGYADVQTVEHEGSVLMGVMVSDEQRRVMVPHVEIVEITPVNGEVVPAGDRAVKAPAEG